MATTLDGKSLSQDASVFSGLNFLITGTVTDADGKPVLEAFVLAISSGSETIRTRTDAEGRFSFRFPADIPMSAVVALKDGLGMDYLWTMEDSSQRKKSDRGR